MKHFKSLSLCCFNVFKSYILFAYFTGLTLSGRWDVMVHFKIDIVRFPNTDRARLAHHIRVTAAYVELGLCLVDNGPV